MLTASLDDFSIFGADFGAQMAQGDGAEADLCVLLEGVVLVCIG